MLNQIDIYGLKHTWLLRRKEMRWTILYFQVIMCFCLEDIARMTLDSTMALLANFMQEYIFHQTCK